MWYASDCLVSFRTILKKVENYILNLGIIVDSVVITSLKYYQLSAFYSSRDLTRSFYRGNLIVAVRNNHRRRSYTNRPRMFWFAERL